MPKKRIQDQEQTAFAARLSKYVEEAGGITQFASACELSPSTIHSYLHGADPSRRNLIAMAKAAGVSVGRMASGTGNLEDRDGYFPVRQLHVDDQKVAVNKERPWSEGQVRIFIDQETVKATFRKASGNRLLLVKCTDAHMQPRIYRDEHVVVDGNDDNVDDGIFALGINRTVKLRNIEVSPDGSIRVYDCKLGAKGRIFYKREEFRGKVTVIGRVVISGHYPDIKPD